ncbi:hypothetical protein C6497_05855 [Candidatus Poribacteria bacterium]|nr:MAG: hypothetical protein C6497_05855 [Candidatus Poribacteria bacterium]
MSSLNFNYNHNHFTKTIQLYGDRAGGEGNFEFAGLAELQNQKLLLVHGNIQSLEQTHDWRRLYRLIKLAERLNLPATFWNLHILKSATRLYNTSLALGTAIRDIQTEILKFPYPIISVFDENYDWGDHLVEYIPLDGSVIVLLNEQIPTEPSKLKQNHLKIIHKQEDLQMEILKLLQDLSNIPKDELIIRRLDSFNTPK